MKTIKQKTVVLLLLIISSCQAPKSDVQVFSEQIEQFEEANQDAIIDTLYLGETDIQNYFSSLQMDQDFKENFELVAAENKVFLMASNPLIDDLCPARPRQMKDLTDGLEVRHVYFNKDSNVDLTLFGWLGPKLENKQVLIMSDFLQHKNTLCTDGKVRKYGVGVRMFLFVSKKRKKVSLELPKLAANVELNRAKATYELKTLGLVGDKVLDALPKSGEFNVENYANVIKAVDNIIRLAKDNTDGVIITPQLIPNSNTD